MHANCQECSQNPWVQRANRYINNSTNRPDRVETVKFLLRNGSCGIEHRVPIKAIRSHLRVIGFNYSRPRFQELILTELKRQGIVATLIYPGRKGGVFIPCNQGEIRIVCEQVFRRVIQELSNLEGSAQATSLLGVVSSARQQIENLRSKI